MYSVFYPSESICMQIWSEAEISIFAPSPKSIQMFSQKFPFLSPWKAKVTTSSVKALQHGAVRSYGPSEGHEIWQFHLDGFTWVSNCWLNESLLSSDTSTITLLPSIFLLKAVSVWRSPIGFCPFNFRTGTWHKDNFFLLVDDLPLQKGKCVTNEHDFQSTSQLSGTVFFGWSSKQTPNKRRSTNLSPSRLIAVPSGASLWREKPSCPDQTVLTNVRAGWKFSNETTSMLASPPCSAGPQASKHGAHQPPAPTANPCVSGAALPQTQRGDVLTGSLHLPHHSLCSGHPWGADLGSHAALSPHHPHAGLCPLTGWTPGARCPKRPPLHPSPTPSSPEPPEKAGPGRILPTFYLFIYFNKTLGGSGCYPDMGWKRFYTMGWERQVSSSRFPPTSHPTSTLLSLHN